jgi:hypothetical protein
MQYTDKWKLRPPELIIALEDLDFSFLPEEAETTKKMWHDGKHIADIAEKLQRDIDEIAILIMHMARRGEIEKRKSGALGI